MPDTQTKTGKTAKDCTAIFLGNVLGLVLGSGLVAGICGWQLWAAYLSEAEASAGGNASTITTPSARTTPAYDAAAPSYGAYSPYGTTNTYGGGSNYGTTSSPYARTYSSGTDSAKASSDSSGQPQTGGFYTQPLPKPAGETDVSEQSLTEY